MYIFVFLLFSNLPELIHTKFVPVALPDIYQKWFSTYTFLCGFRLKKNFFLVHADFFCPGYDFVEALEMSQNSTRSWNACCCMCKFWGKLFLSPYSEIL